MQNINFFHKKKRNIGLIYNIIINRMTKALLENNEFDYEKLYKIIKESFGKNSELKKELQYYLILEECKAKNLNDSSRIYKKIMSSINDVDINKLDKELSILFKNISNYDSSNKLLDEVKIKNYKVLATIQQLIEYNRNKAKYVRSVPKILILENSLIEDIVSRSNTFNKEDIYFQNITNNAKILNEKDIKLMVNRFYDKYNILSETQKKTVDQYILSMGSNKEFLEYVKNEYNRLSEYFDHYLCKLDDKVVKVKIEEVQKVIDELIALKNNRFFMSENGIAILLDLQLIEENIKKILSNDDKNISSVIKEQYEKRKKLNKSIEAIVYIDSGTTKSPKEISVGYKFLIYFDPENIDIDSINDDEISNIYKTMIREFETTTSNFIRNEFYNTLFSLNSQGFYVDNYIHMYPNSLIVLPWKKFGTGSAATLNPSHYKVRFGNKKKQEIFIIAPLEISDKLPAEEIYEKVFDVLGSTKILNSRLFKDNKNLPWKII